MLAGEPDGFSVLDDEKIFLKGGGLGGHERERTKRGIGAASDGSRG